MASRSKKRSSAASDYDSDGDFVVSDGEDQGRLKRARTGNKPGPSSSRKVDSNGDVYWEISNLRRVTISTFKGKTMVNIREYYEKDGQELPGKKGISLPMDQFSSLIRRLPEIEEVLLQKGESVPRPSYAEGKSEHDKKENAAGDSRNTGSTVGKKNIEATSDEDEGES